MGPWGVFLHEPVVGQAPDDGVEAIFALKRLSNSAKLVAILVKGAFYKAAYALYAHAATAEREGMAPGKVAALAAGQRPVNLTPDEIAAIDVTFALLKRGVLPDTVYTAARDRLGHGGLKELVLWVGLYTQVSTTLSAFDLPSAAEYPR